jgi:hypothetical protein
LPTTQTAPRNSTDRSSARGEAMRNLGALTAGRGGREGGRRGAPPPTAGQTIPHCRRTDPPGQAAGSGRR